MGIFFLDVLFVYYLRFARSPKPLLTGVACLTCFLIGLLFVTGAGEYWLTLFDRYKFRQHPRCYDLEAMIRKIQQKFESAMQIASK